MAENRQYRIVIADDDPIMRRLLRSCCERAGGTDVRDFANGADALEYVRGLEYLHLLVTDLVMPKMRGDALIPEARKKFPDLTAILVSGGNDDALKSAKEIAYELNARFYEKPITNISGFIEAIMGCAPKQ